MAQIVQMKSGGAWEMLPLPAQGMAIDPANPETPLRPREDSGTAADGVSGLIYPVADDDPTRPARCSLLMLAPGTPVRINGSRAPAYLGIHVLRHRDEIVIDESRRYYSTEDLPKLAPLPETDDAASCPRCHLELVSGTPGVRCPQCGTLHHQSDERPCWLFSTTCALCDYPVRLGDDADFLWSPSDL